MDVKGKKVNFTAGFYELGSMHCRKWLDISIDRSEAKPDLTVIMMNPGSAKPDEKDGCEVAVDAGSVEVKGDQTLYRIAALMRVNSGIKRIRVLNLSDFREADCKKFYGYLEDPVLNGMRHSIFCKEREADLRSMIGQGQPVLLAWGMSEKTSELKVIAIRRLREIGADMLNFEDGKLHYPH